MKFWPPFIFLLLLTSFGRADSVRLSWEASPSTNVVAYRIYCGTNSQVYSEIVNVSLVQTQFVALPHRGRWFFAATAVDADGVESDFSNEVIFELKPAPPVMRGKTWVRLTPVIQRSTNLVSWDSVLGEPTLFDATNAVEFFTTRRLLIERVQLVANP